jgi:ankyrin repeat protein
LFYAIGLPTEEMVRFLMEKKVRLDVKDKQGRLPVYYAASMGCDETIKLFIANPEVDFKASTNMGRGPLLKAAFKGRVSAAKLLLESGLCDLSQTDKHGQTALHQAVWGDLRGDLAEKLKHPDSEKNRQDESLNLKDSPEIALLLIQHGIDPNTMDSRGYTPLSAACSTRGLDSIQVLLEHGADINAAGSPSKTTPLHSSIFNGNVSCIQKLFELGGDKLDTSVRTKYGYNNLELAAEVENGYLVFEAILKWEEEGFALRGLELEEERPARLLHCAVNSDRVKTLEILLNYFACFISQHQIQSLIH